MATLNLKHIRSFEGPSKAFVGTPIAWSIALPSQSTSTTIRGTVTAAVAMADNTVDCQRLGSHTKAVPGTLRHMGCMTDHYPVCSWTRRDCRISCSLSSLAFES